MILKIKKRLEVLKGRFLSLIGRITLIKFVLSSLAIFHLSLFKALVQIYKLIEQIHNKFLWGGYSENRKMHWFQWKLLYLLLKKVGLSFKSFK